MKYLRPIALYSILAIFFVGCSTTKNIPEGSFLLNDITVKHDTRNATSDLETFVSQQPNSSFLFIPKFRLRLYNMAGQDTTKWVNRFIRKIGEPPVIFSDKKAMQSSQELLKESQNQGYLNAEVDTTMKAKGKKLSITYTISSKEPYRIRNYEYTIEDTTMARIMRVVPLKPLLHTGDYFDMTMLEEERDRINLIMRNAGYYNFSKEYVYFKADTTLNSKQVDLFLNIYPAHDSLPYPRAKINKITVVSGINAQEATNIMQGLAPSANRRGRIRRSYISNADTTLYRDISIVRGRRKFLRTSSIYKNLYLRKGQNYSDRALTKTYEAYNKMGAIKQVNITTSPSPEDSLHLVDATVLLTPANAHWFRASLDGTNSAGDIGVAPSVSYQHQNLFNGSELFIVKLKGAYEFITGDNNADLLNENYYEYGVETSLTFPLFVFPWLKKDWRERPSASTRFSAGINKQVRSEYKREFFNMGATYNWATYNNRIRHGIDLFDINYIRMPWVSAKFDSLYLNNPNNPLLKESYKDQLIARTAYSFTLINGARFNPLYPTYALRATVEVAGHLPRLATSLGKDNRDSDGQRKLLGVAYAEYLKANFDYARTFYFSKKHSLAYHVNFGAAHPYGNSKILPFERRFFSGGANSIRGWSTRTLGPGSYRSNNAEQQSDFVNQAGDMKIEFSIENRSKISELFEVAAFIDAGNIWTIKKYESQAGGQFKLNSFYKEIAVAYGAGLRFDLSFLLLRFDLGMKAYDPGLKQSDRFVLHKPRFSRMAFHFGIGYPF